MSKMGSLVSGRILREDSSKGFPDYADKEFIDWEVVMKKVLTFLLGVLVGMLLIAGAYYFYCGHEVITTTGEQKFGQIIAFVLAWGFIAPVTLVIAFLQIYIPFYLFKKGAGRVFAFAGVRK